MKLLRLQAAITVVCAAALFLITSSALHAAEPFYKGKRITLLINFAAGGPTDIEGRLFAKYLVKHIEGEPGIIVQNMDGAGCLVGASYLGEVAPKDGTYIGYLSGTSWLYVSEPERWRVFDMNSTLQRLIVLPPGTPRAAYDALRIGIEGLNSDKDFAADALRAIEFVPDYPTAPDMSQKVRAMIRATPEMRSFINDYMRNVPKN